MANDYFKQLTHPKWQAKRLRIFERDGFECRGCGDSSTTLNVHHVIYRKVENVWDYEDSDLITFCELCHADVTYLKKVVKNQIDLEFVFKDQLFELSVILDFLSGLNPYHLMMVKKLIEKYNKKNK